MDRGLLIAGNNFRWQMIGTLFRQGAFEAVSAKGKVIMPYWVQAKIKGGAVSVVVETAQGALAKVAELTESGHTEVAVRDLMGAVIGLTALQAEAGKCSNGNSYAGSSSSD